MGETRYDIDEDCCDVWPLIALRFEWMLFSDDLDVATMPHMIGKDGSKFFVNFCPSCGKPARNRNMLNERTK